MKSKNFKGIKNIVVLAAMVVCWRTALAQTSTSAMTEVDRETLYSARLEDRAADMLKALGLTNAAAAGKVHDLIITQYRVMRARDALIDAQLKAMGQEINFTNRAAKLADESKQLHDYFFGKLAGLLTPEQVEKIKDKLTYDKAKITADAYTAIVPGLTETEKAKVLEWLKAAREEAVDGGSAPEKSAIFQKYKDQINAYLNANGHDVAKAYQDWEAKQAAAKTNAEPAQK